MVVVDEDELASLEDLMGDRFNVFVDTYIDGSEDYLLQIRSGIENQDAHAVQHAAHPLKSSTRQFACEEVAQIAETIEQAAKNQDFNIIIQEIDLLEEKFNLFKEFLKKRAA